MWEETFKSHSDSKPNGELYCVSSSASHGRTLWLFVAVFLLKVKGPNIALNE